MDSSSPSVICVSGMLRVLPTPVATPAMPPADPAPPASPERSPCHSAAASPPPVATPLPKPALPHPSPITDASPHTPCDRPPNPLTQKQVRELRRLCRKTANRAHFENRAIQLRQVASIAAMGAPSAPLFDPDNHDSGTALRAWVDAQRAHGADWRDERPLSNEAVEELRNWDRLLKQWAKVRFEVEDVVPTELTFETVTPVSNPLPLEQTPVPTKNVERIVPREVSFASPVSVDVTPEPFKRQVRQPMAEVCINRVGDTINIYVPVTEDQENIHPNRRLPTHAADTAVSWRASPSEAGKMGATLFRTGNEPVKPIKDWTRLRRTDRSQIDGVLRNTLE